MSSQINRNLKIRFEIFNENMLEKCWNRNHGRRFKCLFSLNVFHTIFFFFNWQSNRFLIKNYSSMFTDLPEHSVNNNAEEALSLKRVNHSQVSISVL